jgi:hypothetical protein
MVDVDFEKLIVKALFANNVVQDKVVPLLDEKWFNIDVLTIKIVSKIIDFHVKYETMPSITDMRVLIKDPDELATFEECMSIKDEDVESEFIVRRN